MPPLRILHVSYRLADAGGSGLGLPVTTLVNQRSQHVNFYYYFQHAIGNWESI